MERGLSELYGEVIAFGSNSLGQLGIFKGSVNSTAVPIKIPNILARSISCGYGLSKIQVLKFG